MRLVLKAISFTLALAVALGARPAAADDSGTARALFDEAKKLVAAGKLDEACPKFSASLKIDPKPGTALNLADCYEKSGKTASAWSRYLEAASLADRNNQPERVEYAREHAKALEPKLSRLTIVVTGAASETTILRDGAPLDAAAWGTAVPVDPGKHVVEASAPGKEKWSGAVDVVSGGVATLTVPLLPSKVEPPSSAPPPSAQASLLKPAGIVTAGLGVVGLGVGAAFGASALSAWSDVKKACPELPKCDEANASKQRDASTLATASTIGFVAGGAAAALGVVLIVAAPRASKAAPTTTGLAVRAGLGTISFDGRF